MDGSELLTLTFANSFYQLLLAVLLGIFIGMRTERKHKKPVIRCDIMGIRTSSLLVVLGVVTTFFDESQPFFFISMFLCLAMLMLLAYIGGVIRLKRYGLTSEVSALLMFLIGVLIGREQIFIAVFLSVLLGISNAYKGHIRSFTNRFSLEEWSGTLQLLVISAIVLPLLPQEPIDPFGVIVPFEIWLLVIFISGMGFIGYFVSKFFDEKKSILFVSFFGALASSTATTTALARKSKQNQAADHLLLVGTLIATAVMQLRVTIVILVVTKFSTPLFAVPSIVMMCSAFVFAILYLIITTKNNTKGSVITKSLSSPFEIKPALIFAILFCAVLYAIHFGNVFFGSLGVYVSAFIAALADVDAVVFSSLLSYADGALAQHVALYAISIAVVVNTIIKLFYIYVFGSRSFFMISFWSLLLVSFAGTITVLLIS